MVKRIGTLFISGLLLVALAGSLIGYLAVVNNLPSQIYTASQQEYLSYNAIRSISQLAPTWNVVESGGRVATILPVQESHIQATLTARYEEQESVSVTVYGLDFRGEYHLANSDPTPTPVELFFPFPGNLETLHEVRFFVDGEEPPDADYTTRGISWQAVLEPGEEHHLVISYRADGANNFAYGMHHNQRTDVDVTLTVVGLVGSEIPKTSLPPTANELTDDGQIFTWKYRGLIADRDIQITMPTRLSFRQRLAQLQDDFRTLARLAPFLVALFLASLAGVLHVSDVRLRLESYLLAGLGLALFYPTLTYLSGVVGVILASALALTFVSGLLLAFLGLTVGWRQIWWRAGLLLVVFLGLFSLGMLTPWRGLLASVGALSLVGTFMLLYARRPIIPEPEPAPQSAEIPPESKPISQPDGVASESEVVLISSEAGPESDSFYCLHCGRALADDYSFCPGCGHNTSAFHPCADCGHRHFVPAEVEPAYCIHCGGLLG